MPLAGNLIPWIDKDLGNGQSKEEWKAGAEANKILGRSAAARFRSMACVYSRRCHALPLAGTDHQVEKRRAAWMKFKDIIASNNRWAKVVPNTREASMQQLSPAAVTGSLTIPVGRLRKMQMGGEYLSAFTVGDQLLWGAAEPLRRTLRIILEK